MARIDVAYADKMEMASGNLSAEGLFDLGLRYCIGREVERDLIAAHKWFNLAAMQGSIEARDYRKEISMDMSTEEIAEAQRGAREWLSTAN